MVRVRAPKNQGMADRHRRSLLPTAASCDGNSQHCVPRSDSAGLVDHPRSDAALSPPHLLDHLRSEIRLDHGSTQTGSVSVDRAGRFIFFHDKHHPKKPGVEEATQFPTRLATGQSVAAGHAQGRGLRCRRRAVRRAAAATAAPTARPATALRSCPHRPTPQPPPTGPPS